MNADDVQRRGLVSIAVDYKSWMRYGDRDDRFRARTVAWVLAGGEYRAPRWQGPRPGRAQEPATAGRSTDHGGPTVGTPQQGGNPA